MTARKTPYLRLHYPWADDVVSASSVAQTAQDIDQALVGTSSMLTGFSRFASVVVQRAAAQSITKSTITAISFDTVLLNNGANSPLANGSWYNVANPTRVTAPVACVVLAAGQCGYSLGSALGANGFIQTFVTLNGASTQPGVQAANWSPISTAAGQQWVPCLSMWKLAAGDYLELKTAWSGSPAGPFNTDTAIPPMLSLSMVALPSVP